MLSRPQHILVYVDRTVNASRPLFCNTRQRNQGPFLPLLLFLLKFQLCEHEETRSNVLHAPRLTGFVYEAVGRCGPGPARGGKMSFSVGGSKRRHFHSPRLHAL